MLNVLGKNVPNELTGRKGYEFKIYNFNIVSTNHMYYYGVSKQGRVYKTRTTSLDYMYDTMYSLFKNITEIIENSNESIKSVIDDIVKYSGIFCLNIYCHHSTLFYKNGNRKRYDTSNRIKSTEDVLVETITHILFDSYHDKSRYDDTYHDRVYANRFEIPDDVDEHIEIGLYVNKLYDTTEVYYYGSFNIAYSDDLKKYVVYTFKDM